MTFTLIEKLNLQKDAGGAVKTEWNAAIDRCIQIIPEQTRHGRVFHPANPNAKHFAAVAGVSFFPENRLQHIRALGFEVAETNGQPIPIPHPWKGYGRQPQPEPKHVMDEA